MPKRPKFKYNYKKSEEYKIRTLQRKVRQLDKQVEINTHDAGDTGTQGTTGAIYPLSQIAQGDASVEREGLQISPVHLQYKIAALANTTLSQYIRFIFFVDTQNHGVYPTVADLLESDSSFSWPEHNTRPRFQILRDICIPLSVTSKPTVFKKGIIKFKSGFKIWYNGGTAAEVSNGKNSLFCYVVSSDNVNQPTSNFYTRLRFKDT